MSEKQIEPSPSAKKIEYPSKFSVKLKQYLYNLRHYVPVSTFAGPKVGTETPGIDKNEMEL